MIEKDKISHPSCHYSISSSQSSSFLNNNYTQETIRRILRFCPGEKPVEIFSKKDKSNGTSQNNNNQQNFSESLPSKSFDDFPCNRFPHPFSSFFDLLHQFPNHQEDIFPNNDNFSAPSLPPHEYRNRLKTNKDNENPERFLGDIEKNLSYLYKN